MNITSPGFVCPSCNDLLHLTPINAELSACAHCKARILTDDYVKHALALASAGEAWVDRATWKETIRNGLLAVALFPIDLLRIVNLVIAPITAFILLVLCAGIAIRLFNGTFTLEQDLPSVGVTMGLLIPIGLVFILPRVERVSRKLLPNQFVFAPCLITSSSGLTILRPESRSVYIPWLNIVQASFSTGSSATQVIYIGDEGQKETLTIPGEDYADILDILRARCPEVELIEYRDLTI